jgi:hypothetical protein
LTHLGGLRLMFHDPSIRAYLLKTREGEAVVYD